MPLAIPLFAAAALLWPPAAHAFEPLGGFFVAEAECEAVQSIGSGSNPGQIRTESLRAYDMLGRNAPGGGFYLIRIPDAPGAPDRWVPVECGTHFTDGPGGGSSGGGQDPRPAPDPVAEPSPKSRENVLALSWQPAFCEIRARTRECRDLNGGGLPEAGTQLSIHGLWPQPRGTEYCDVPGDLIRIDEDGGWRELPALDLGADTRARLETAMPGTASALDRHQWIKHGTCYGSGAEEYIADTLRLTEAINASGVRDFIARAVGREVSAAEIRARFDAAFGRGAGERVEFTCAGDDGRTLIQEMRIHLSGTIGPETPVADLILAADPVPPGCGRGIVDRAGLQ